MDIKTTIEFTNVIMLDGYVEEAPAPGMRVVAEGMTLVDAVVPEPPWYMYWVGWGETTWPR